MQYDRSVSLSAKRRLLTGTSRSSWRFTVAAVINIAVPTLEGEAVAGRYPPYALTQSNSPVLQFLKHLSQRWADWCGDRDMENAIRSHLTKEGYYGATVKLQNVRLVAVQRPGWVQVYRFEAVARLAVAQNEDLPDQPPEHHTLLGLVKDDGRRGAEVRTFHSPEQRRELFTKWADGLLCLRGSHGLLDPTLKS